MFKVLKTDGAARRGEFSCPHGTVQTPVFMNVGTQAAIKGALSAADLETIGTQVELSNTYHLHLRPGDEVVRDMGGLHKFMTWDGPILTDSGGFQVFSLAGLRKIKEEGVTFASHLDGHKIFMGPEESMRIQSNLGSDIILDGIGADGDISKDAREKVSALLKRSFRPEFLNRLDEIVFYKPLTRENIKGIVDLLVADLAKRLADRQIKLNVTPAAKDYIISNGYDPIYGARPLKRFIQSKVETLVAKKIISDDIAPDSTITVDIRDGELVATV